MIEASETTLSQIIEAQKVCLVDFTATWCGPCNTMKPVLAAFEKNTGTPVVQVDVNKNPGVTQTHGVRSVPTLVLFRNGNEVRRLVGAQKLQGLMQFVGG